MLVLLGRTGGGISLKCFGQVDILTIRLLEVEMPLLIEDVGNMSRETEREIQRKETCSGLLLRIGHRDY